MLCLPSCVKRWKIGQTQNYFREKLTIHLQKIFILQKSHINSLYEMHHFIYSSSIFLPDSPIRYICFKDDKRTSQLIVRYSFFFIRNELLRATSVKYLPFQSTRVHSVVFIGVLVVFLSFPVTFVVFIHYSVPSYVLCTKLHSFKLLS